jgi:hypothetical protein
MKITSLTASASVLVHSVTWVLSTRWRWGRRGVHPAYAVRRAS